MKLYLKLNLYLLSFLLSPFVLAQEGIISGRLQDQQQLTIPYVTVSVLKLPDSTLVTGTTTDMEGEFELKPSFSGEVLLRFSAIGFAEKMTPAFHVSGAGFTKDFGTLTLGTATTFLDEVTINTWKPRIKAESGKMVMSVEGTTMAAGSSAYEILTRAPGVSADPSGGLSINGKKGVSVMIDGRLTYLSPDDIKSLLENMPAENIAEIEVIHNPSAKYDAEGTAGMLNIKLKENNLSGISGSVYGGIHLSEQQLFNGGLNLNHKKGKWNSFFNFDYTKDGFHRKPTFERVFPEGHAFSGSYQTGMQEIFSYIPSLRVGSDYEINDRHTIGAMAHLTFEEENGYWNTQTTLTDPNGAEAMQIVAQNREDNSFNNNRFNLNYQWEIDTLGSSLSANFDYASLNTESDSRFVNDYFYPTDASEETRFLSNRNLVEYDIYAGQVDFNLPLSSRSNLEFGLKASRVISESDLDAFEGEAGNRVIDQDLSDNFKYHEEIYAAHATYNNRLNDTWNIQAGLRAEKTSGEATTLKLDEPISRDNFQLFPNLQVEQKVSENYKINYGYSRRIFRADYKKLNPAVFFIDPYTAIVGNPELRAQINNSFQVSQNLFQKYNLMLSYDFSEHQIVEVPSTNPETGITEIVAGNIDSYKSYNASLNLPMELASFWNTNNNITFTRQIYSMDLDGQPYQNKSNYLLVQSNHQVMLPKDIKLELTGTYRSESVYGFFRVDGMLWFDLGLKKSFMNNKLDVTLRATDLFRGMELNIKEDYLGNQMTLDQYLDNQVFSINVRYSFSKGSKTKETRSNTLEELDRAGA